MQNVESYSRNSKCDCSLQIIQCKHFITQQNKNIPNDLTKI